MVNPPEPPVETGLEARSRKLFERSVSDLDASVRSRLTQARATAIAQLERPSRLPLWRPAAGLIAAALVAALVFVPDNNPALQSPQTALADNDMPMLLDSDNLELLEDMEFYAWLDNQALDGTAVIQPADALPADPTRS